jgi:ABC-type Zn uptake system ZnuABC Zn-binding protein ZnuA
MKSTRFPFRSIGLLFVSLLVMSWPARAAIKVASLSTILTEIAQEVGGDKVEVTGIVKAGVDPHEFEPSPEDMKIIGASQLVLATGKGLEGYLLKLKETTPGATFVEVGNSLPSLRMKSDAGATIEDPHWWHSIANVEQAVRVVQDALTRLSPQDKDDFAQRAGAYEERLQSLEQWVRVKLAELPRDQRKLVTSHDAFQYFARDYGFKLYPIEGVSTDDQPSSRKVIDLITTIKDERVKAVFFENIENPKVITEITRETGAKVGGELYADGLGTGDEGTYVGMVKHNVSTIVDSLK